MPKTAYPRGIDEVEKKSAISNAPFVFVAICSKLMEQRCAMTQINGANTEHDALRNRPAESIPEMTKPPEGGFVMGFAVPARAHQDMRQAIQEESLPLSNGCLLGNR